MKELILFLLGLGLGLSIHWSINSRQQRQLIFQLDQCRQELRQQKSSIIDNKP